MKCEKCGNEYPNQYDFAAPDLCRYCYMKLTDLERENLKSQNISLISGSTFDLRQKFGKRLLATIIDYAIVLGLVMIIYYISGFFKSYMAFAENLQEYQTDTQMIIQLQKEFFKANMSSFIFGQVVWVAYYSLEVFISASLGKLILGLRIGNDDSSRSSVATLLTRFLIKSSGNILFLFFFITGNFLIYIIGFLSTLVLFIGYFFILGQKRQGLHDQISKTAIFHKSNIS